MSKKTTLKQYLMKTGKFEKVFQCVNAIRNGKITVDNEKIINPNHYFNPNNSLVKIHGEKLRPTKKLYFYMNKPAGYICQKSLEDKTIFNLLNNLNISKEEKASLFAVGRLDRDTEGLLIITNDGRISDSIMNPESEIKKEYYVVLERPFYNDQIRRVEKGIRIRLENEYYRTKPCKIKPIGKKKLYITITEGKKRQIRRSFEAVGNKVSYLRRTQIGNLKLDNLKPGKFKQIDRERMLRKLKI